MFGHSPQLSTLNSQLPHHHLRLFPIRPYQIYPRLQVIECERSRIFCGDDAAYADAVLVVNQNRAAFGDAFDGKRIAR